MRVFELPHIEGTAEQQLQQIKDFLFLQSEALNYNFSQTTPERTWQATQAAMQTATNPAAKSLAQDNFEALRDMIVGTADLAVRQSDVYQKVLQEVYGAQSQLGTVTEQLTTQITANAANILLNTAYIGRVETALSSYEARQEHFIKTGYLDANRTTFGVEIGLLEASYTEENGSVTVLTPKKVQITPDKVSFWSKYNKAASGQTANYDWSEVAYIQENAIYFPNAQITGGTITIGSNFTVTNEGNLTAKNGTFTGSIEGGSININENFIVLGNGFMTAKMATLEGDTWINDWYVGSKVISTRDDGDNIAAGIGRYLLKAGTLFEIKTAESGNNITFNGMYVGGTERIDSSGNGKFNALYTNGTQRIDASGNGAFSSVAVGSYGIGSNGYGSFNGVSGGAGSFTSVSSTGAVSGTKGTFTGAVSGTTGTFSSLSVGSMFTYSTVTRGTQNDHANKTWGNKTFILNKGKWLINAFVHFASATNATGARVACISTSQPNSVSVENSAAVGASNGTASVVNITKMLTITSDNTTVYIGFYHSQGASLTVTTYAEYMQIGTV